jgi:hypothetical protein
LDASPHLIIPKPLSVQSSQEFWVLISENNRIMSGEDDHNLGGVDSGGIQKNNANIQQNAATHLESEIYVSAASSVDLGLPLPSSSPSKNEVIGIVSMKPPDNNASDKISGGNKTDGSPAIPSDADGSVQANCGISSACKPETQSLRFSVSPKTNSRGWRRGSGGDLEGDKHGDVGFF